MSLIHRLIYAYGGECALVLTSGDEVIVSFVKMEAAQ